MFGNNRPLFPAVSPMFPAVMLETMGMSGAEPCGCGCGLSPEDWRTIKAALCWNYRHLGRELGVTRTYAYLLCRRPHKPHRKRLLAAMEGLFDRLRANPAARRILARAGYWLE
jgi:hypothetical protein